MQGKIPSLSPAYKELQFLEIPSELADLKVLEERILAPRIGVIQICQSFVDTQRKSKGRIVNVPNDMLKSILRSLPSPLDNINI